MENRKKQLKIFLKQNKLNLKRIELLEEALTHRSYKNESYNDKITNNERLEYLGDSILNLVINEYLFHRFPNYQEGELAQISSSLVRESTLARIATDRGLGHAIRLSKGERKSGGDKRPSNLADCLEAIIAALYLEQGLHKTQKHILKWFENEFSQIQSPAKAKDPKSHLQEITQKYCQELPIYEEVHYTGPAHRRTYTMRVLIQGKEYARASGSSRKIAESKAAQKALEPVSKQALLEAIGRKS